MPQRHIPADTWDRLLREAINDAFPSSCNVLDVPGVYEILTEYFNNEIIERWDVEQTADEEPR
jgi:hypothetical protein